MKHLILTFLMLLLSVQGWSQDQELDNTISILKKDSLPVRQKGKAIQDYIRSIHMNPEVKEARLKSILPIILQFGEPEYYWNWLISYSTTLQEYGENVKASKLSFELLKAAEKNNNPSWKAQAYVTLYKVHIEMRMNQKAKAFLDKGIEASFEANDPELISLGSYLMGYTFYTERQNDSAIYYLTQSAAYNDKAHPESQTAEYRYLLARTYIRDNQIDKGIALLRYIADQRREIVSERYYNDYYYAGSLMYMSQAYAIKGMIDSSDHLFEKCLASYASFDTTLYYYAHLYNGMTYASTGFYDRAIRSFLYLKDSTEFDMPSEFIGNVYASKGKHKTAVGYYQEALVYKDSAQSAALDEMSKLLDESAKGEMAIQKQIDEEKRIAAEQQAAYQEHQKNLILLGVGIIGILITFFGRMLYKRYKIIKAQKEEINNQKMQVEEKNEEIISSINYAKRIQEAIMPPNKVFKQYLPESFILYKPKDVVAGDFYWMEPSKDRIIFAAADCTGHGVPGAMVSVVCNNALNRSVREFKLTDPGQILDKTRELVIETFEKSENEVKDGMDIALCSIEPAKDEQRYKTLYFAGANNSLYIIRDGELLEFKADKQPIGVFADTAPYHTHTVELQKGDLCFVYTDGFADQFGGEKGKKFKPKNFRDLLIKYQNEPIQKIKLLLDTAFEKWRGDMEQVDDVCVIGVRV